MKELIEYDRVTIYLDKLSDYVRNEMFPDLQKPVITLQKTTGSYGHFETVPMWKCADGSERYEINLGSETITRPIENVVATLIHEYTHYYNHMHGIKDVSRGGTYHNKKFKEEAEKHMIHIDHDDRIGFSITSPTDELIEWCINHDLQDIKLGRGMDFYSLFGIKPTGTSKKPTTGTRTAPTTKKPSSTRKYICPICKTSVRATKDVNIMCMDCNEQMIKA